MPGYSAIVEIIEPEVQHDAKEEGEVEQGEIGAILRRAYFILHDTVYAKYPERFDQCVGKDEQQEVSGKFLTHSSAANLDKCTNSYPLDRNSLY
jgi:hypothetical protein